MRRAAAHGLHVTRQASPDRFVQLHELAQLLVDSKAHPHPSQAGVMRVVAANRVAEHVQRVLLAAAAKSALHELVGAVQVPLRVCLWRRHLHPTGWYQAT